MSPRENLPQPFQPGENDNLGVEDPNKKKKEDKSARAGGVVSAGTAGPPEKKGSREVVPKTGSRELMKQPETPEKAKI